MPREFKDRGYKYRHFVSVEVDNEDQAKRLKAALTKELPGLVDKVFAEIDKETASGEVVDSWEIQ